MGSTAIGTRADDRRTEPPPTEKPRPATAASGAGITPTDPVATLCRRTCHTTAGWCASYSPATVVCYVIRDRTIENRTFRPVVQSSGRSGSAT